MSGRCTAPGPARTTHAFRTPGAGLSGSPTIFLSAGEPSGDLHGAPLVRALRERVPDARIVGLGGRRMAAEGMEVLVDVGDLAVMGFAEVVRRIPYFLRLERQIASRFHQDDISLFLPIDFPGLNLRLARRARRAGVPVLYFIAPQVWAWRAHRARGLARDAARVAVILPFEEEFLRRAGVNATFVGHPLLEHAADDEPRRSWCTRMGLDPDRPVLALFPGSRGQEIIRHGELFSEAARRVVGARPEVQPVVGFHPDVPASRYGSLPFPRVSGSDGLLAHATAALVKSGTSTLEAALAGVPFVVSYRVHPLSFAVARRVVNVPHVALANLVAGKRVVPELLQEDATPGALADAILPLLDPESEARREMLAGLAEIRARLGGPGAADRVAEMAIDLLGDGTS